MSYKLITDLVKDEELQYKLLLSFHEGRKANLDKIFESLIKRCDKNMINGRGSVVSKWDIEKIFNRLEEEINLLNR